MVQGANFITKTDKRPPKQQDMFTFVASTWLEWSIILNWGLGGRIFDLEPIGFCPLLGKYGPGVGTRKKIINIKPFQEISLKCQPLKV